MDENYNTAFQTLILGYMISDPDSFARSCSIIKAEYFDDRLRPVARFVLDYADQYKHLPTTTQVHAITNVTIESQEIGRSQSQWYLDNIEKFCRYKAIESAVLSGVDLLKKGEGASIETLLKEAVQISLLKDLGTNYFDSPKERLERLKDRSNFISTGWKTLDDKLFGGFTRGSLNLFAGYSGTGKSLLLQNMARKWALSGKNVVYISLELSEDLINFRLDSMFTGDGSSTILKNVNSTVIKVANITRQNNVGKLMVKKLPEGGTTCNTIRAYLKEYEIQEGIVPDVLIVDYLDLLYPNNNRIDISNLWIKDKYVAEELRSIATDLNVPVVSASQLNRQSIDAQEFDQSHIAGGITKINTADNVFGIFTSQSMRERGVYQLQFIKTRTAAAVGDKIELAYNIDSMAIDDLPEDAEITRPKTAEEIREQLKTSAPTSTREVTLSKPKIVPEGKKLSEIAHPSPNFKRGEIREERPFGINDILEKSRLLGEN